MFDPRITVANWPTSVQRFAFRGEKVSPPSLFPLFASFPTKQHGARKGKGGEKKSIADGHYDVAKRQGGGRSSSKVSPRRVNNLSRLVEAGEKSIKGKLRGLGLAPWALIASGLVPRLFPVSTSFICASKQVGEWRSWRNGMKEGEAREQTCPFFFIYLIIYLRGDKSTIVKVKILRKILIESRLSSYNKKNSSYCYPIFLKPQSHERQMATWAIFRRFKNRLNREGTRERRHNETRRGCNYHARLRRCTL